MTPLSMPFFAADGKTVIVAIDHALGSGQVPPLDYPVPLLARVCEGRPDGLILTPGMARLCEEGAAPWLLTADYYASSTLPGATGDDEIHALVFGASSARMRGAAGLKCLLVYGVRDPELLAQNLASVARLIDDAHDIGLPVMVEAVLWGRGIAASDQRDAVMVAHAARAAFEIGADVIKIPLPDDLVAVAKLAEALPVPLVAMGGPASDPAGLFAHLAGAVAAGIRGVALGRNVWQSPDPAAYTRALRAIVHEGATGSDALAVLAGSPAGYDSSRSGGTTMRPPA